MSLSISYDGDNVRTGLMDAQELAPALLAAGTLIQKANRILNGENIHVDLKVRSDFQRGSRRATPALGIKELLERYPLETLLKAWKLGPLEPTPDAEPIGTPIALRPVTGAPIAAPAVPRKDEK
jgi:hypothetical protein